MSRAQTLVLALLALHVLLGALSLVIGRGEHKSAALRWWGWGLLVYAAGLLVTITVPVVPRPLAGAAGNTLISVSPVLCAMGIVSHARFSLSRVWVGAGAAFTVALLIAANALDYQAALANLIVPTPIAIVMFLIAAWVIVRDGPRDARMANQFLAGVCVLAVAVWTIRIAVMLWVLEGAYDRERVDIIISLFAIAQMITGVAATLSLFWIDVRLMQAELSRVAHTDSLTGLPNRRAILTRFIEETSRAARHGHHFALAVFDLDHFKQVNDKRGHIVGDEVLKAATAAISGAKRSEDILARIGGEEFAVVLSSQQSLGGAIEAADRLREAVERIEVKLGVGDELRLTMSGGVALYPEDGLDWDALYAAADRRLYAAKRSGRNRVVGRDEQPQGLQK